MTKILPLLLLCTSCITQEESAGYEKPPSMPPAADGHNVIEYTVRIIEDDTDCRTGQPRVDVVTLNWHTDLYFTAYAQGGLDVYDLTLDRDHFFEQHFVKFNCLSGSEAFGRMYKYGGHGRAACVTDTCTQTYDVTLDPRQ